MIKKQLECHVHTVHRHTDTFILISIGNVITLSYRNKTKLLNFDINIY